MSEVGSGSKISGKLVLCVGYKWAAILPSQVIVFLSRPQGNCVITTFVTYSLMERSSPADATGDYDTGILSRHLNEGHVSGLDGCKTGWNMSFLFFLYYRLQLTDKRFTG